MKKQSRVEVWEEIEIGCGGLPIPIPREAPVAAVKEPKDRRTRKRFSLRLPVVCRWIEPCPILDRVVLSESLNMSSKYLVIGATEGFRPGQSIKASIAWPCTLDDGVRLALVVEALVTRTGLDCTVMRIERYQFRTRACTPAATQAMAS